MSGASLGRGFVGFLRSRRLAVSLLLFVIAYSAVGTAIPQVSREPEKIAAWADRYAVVEPLVGMLGLHDAFTAPIFLVALALLFLSTTACAWERTRAAARTASRSRGLTEAEIARLAERPRIRVPAQGVDAAGAIEAVRRALGGVGLSVRTGRRVAQAVGGRWGLAGSPLFHWSLALLFLVIGLGQATRAEGLIGVPIGYPVADVPGNYGHYSAGPWHPAAASGLSVGASDFRLRTPIGGVDRGPSAVVTLSDSTGKMLASGRVYPNNPLRYGAVMVHQSSYGLAAALEVLDPAGAVAGRVQPLLDFDPARPTGMTAARVSMTSADGASHTIEVSVSADPAPDGFTVQLPASRRARISVSTTGAPSVEATLALGESLAVPGGGAVRLRDLVYYTRLTVVDDWSVYPIYALFVLAGAGLSLAVFAPYRAVRVLVVDGPHGLAVHAVAKHSRQDPLFAERAEAALREALDPVPSATDASAPPDSRLTSPKDPPAPDEGA